MKTIYKYAFLYAILLAIFSCKESNSNNMNELPQTTANTNSGWYLPLQVGNEWYYANEIDLSKITESIRITGTAKFNNNVYFVYKVTNYYYFNAMHQDSIVRTSYIRTTYGLKYFGYRDSSEYLIYDFSDSVIDSVYQSKHEIERYTYFDTPIGRFFDCISITFIEQHSFKSTPVGILFSRGVGLIRYSGSERSMPTYLIKSNIINNNR